MEFRDADQLTEGGSQDTRAPRDPPGVELLGSARHDLSAVEGELASAKAALRARMLKLDEVLELPGDGPAVAAKVAAQEAAVQVALKLVEMEEKKWEQYFGRCRALEDAALAVNGFAGGGPLEPPTAGPTVEQPVVSPMAQQLQRAFQPQVKPIRRKKPRAGRLVESGRRLSCFVPFHGFLLEDMANCYSQQRGFDMDKLLALRHSVMPAGATGNGVGPSARSGIRGGLATVGEQARRVAGLLATPPLGFRSAYGAVDTVPMWGMPHTIHDPTWTWNFEEEDVAHAQRDVSVVHSGQRADDSPLSSRRQHVFIFEFGCVVTWNMQESQELGLVSSLQVFGVEPSQAEGAEFASEYIFFEAGTASGIADDVVVLESGEFGERLAYSYALAQSCLLRLFEWRTLQVINRNEHIPLTMIQDGTTHMSQAQISCEMGWVFFERAKISLTTSTDPAQYFWGNSIWETVYAEAREYFDIAERKDRLNAKLAQLKELFDLLNSQASNIHGVHLEWIVIWLIVVEVLCELIWNILIKDVYGYHPGEPGVGSS